jgi:hypothetical protein
MPKKTVQVSEETGVPVLRIRHLLATRQIPPPRKDVSGDYQWFPEGVARLVQVERAKGKLKAAPAPVAVA